LVVGDDNKVYGNLNVVVGLENRVGTSKQAANHNVVVGHDNQVFGQFNAVFGNENVVFGSLNTVIGNDGGAAGNLQTKTSKDVEKYLGFASEHLARLSSGEVAKFENIGATRAAAYTPALAKAQKVESASCKEKSSNVLFLTLCMLFTPDPLPEGVSIMMIEVGPAGKGKPVTSKGSNSAARAKLQALRTGVDVEVSSVVEARALLKNLPEVRPHVETNPFLPGANAGPGTYRGDLINTANPMAPIHQPQVPGQKPQLPANHPHNLNPHYNIVFPDGTKAAIVIKG
jgi:hypothetical protein